MVKLNKETQLEEKNDLDHTVLIDGSRLESALGQLQCVMVARRTLTNPDGITWAQYDVLDMLRLHGSLTPTVLGEKLGLSRSSTSKVLRYLKDTKLIEQVSAESDRREMLTKLSDKGRAFLYRAEASRREMATCIEDVMTPGEQCIFSELCLKAAGALYKTLPKTTELP